MNMRDGMSLARDTACVQDTTCEAISLMESADAGARNELVGFIVHRAFYPVLMVDRAGPHRDIIEHVQAATRAEIERFRSYGSIPSGKLKSVGSGSWRVEMTEDHGLRLFRSKKSAVLESDGYANCSLRLMPSPLRS